MTCTHSRKLSAYQSHQRLDIPENSECHVTIAAGSAHLLTTKVQKLVAAKVKLIRYYPRQLQFRLELDIRACAVPTSLPSNIGNNLHNSCLPR
jgi:hypothetical protein